MKFTEDLKLGKVCVAFDNLTNGKAKAGANIMFPCRTAEEMVERMGSDAYEELHYLNVSLKNIVLIEKKTNGDFLFVCVLALKNQYKIVNIRVAINNDGSLTALSYNFGTDDADDTEKVFTIKNGSRTNKKFDI